MIITEELEVPAPRAEEAAGGNTAGHRRGYETKYLPVVSPDDPNYWSVSDAAKLLGPPELTETQVRQLVHLVGMTPKGKRSGGSRRRHVRVYDAGELSRAYAAIASVLESQAALRCAHCARPVSQGTLGWRHDPGGYTLCLGDDPLARLGTRAEPAVTAVPAR